MRLLGRERARLAASHNITQEELFCTPSNTRVASPDDILYCNAGGPFPFYENGDCFLLMSGWEMLALGRTNQTDAAFAMLSRFLTQYQRTLLWGQRYSWKQGKMHGNDILANTLVGLSMGLKASFGISTNLTGVGVVAPPAAKLEGAKWCFQHLGAAVCVSVRGGRQHIERPAARAVRDAAPPKGRRRAHTAASYPPNPGGKLWFECRPGSGPCNPTPKWPVTYAMNESMMLMAVSPDGLMADNGDVAGTVVPATYPANRWSVFDIDWDTDKPTWGAARPQNCSEQMAKQVADMAASVSPQPATAKRFMTYRNFVKALPLLTSVREIMNDPAFDVWFVNFSSAVQANHSESHVPVCEANMTQCAGGSCSPAGDWSCACVDEVLQPPRCSHLYHDQFLMPASGTAACGPTGRCDTGRVPQGNYLWE